jgi:hypothetical protein
VLDIDANGKVLNFIGQKTEIGHLRNIQSLPLHSAADLIHRVGDFQSA